MREGVDASPRHRECRPGAAAPRPRRAPPCGRGPPCSRRPSAICSPIAHDGVEMARRVLEDHADAVAAAGAHLGLRQCQEVPPAKRTSPPAIARVEDGRSLIRLRQTMRLAGAALADEAEDLALGEIERDAVDDAPPPRSIDSPRTDRTRHSRAPSTSPRPSPRRLKPNARRTIATPGKAVIHQARVMKLCPSKTITPHSGVGG